jgi:ceramide glucosyltransferase
MTALAHFAAAFCVLATGAHLLAQSLTLWRCARGRLPVRASTALPPVTIVRPLCGVDAHEEATLRSAFTLDYPDYEIILCCASAGDRVVPLARRVIAEHPHVRARLLIGNDAVSDNPKLNNIVKGWEAAQHDWIVMADSNVLMPPDYLRRLAVTWREDTGLVCAPPVGMWPGNFAAELECAFLNTYQASWQYAADSAGLGFAQGKTLFWRRDTLERLGGVRALGCEPAEDAAATKLVRAAGLRVRLCDRASFQPLGVRALSHVWSRQVRWARLRRASFPLFFLPEVLTGSVPAVACAALAADLWDLEPMFAAMALGLVWYGAEALVAAAGGWHLSWRSPLAWVLRDALLSLLWISAWIGRGFTWRGNDMQAVRAT